MSDTRIQADWLSLQRWITPERELRLWMAQENARTAVRWFRRATSPFVFTLCGVGCLLLLYTRAFTLYRLGAVRDLQLAIGALVGTILALGLSLSIIPLQRAAEIYSPSILRLFREHRGIQNVSIGLLAICFASFAMVTSPLFGIAPSATVPFAFLLLGPSLDLIRRLYFLIAHLLEPQEAVRRLSEEARRWLRGRHEAFLKTAELSWRALPAQEQKKATREQYLVFLYEKSQVQEEFVRVRSAELAEIAQKATVRSDWSLALAAIDAMYGLAVDAIECRKSALIFRYADFMVSKATAEKPLDRVYEDLLAVNGTALRQGAENVSMMVIRALGTTAEHMTRIRRSAQQAHSAPLAVNPICYCSTAIEEAMSKGMVDAGYEGAATLARVSLAAPTDTDRADVHEYVMKGIFDIVNKFAVSPMAAIHMREPLKRGLEVIGGLLKRNDLYSADVTRRFVRGLEHLLPIGLRLEQSQPIALASHPIGPPYDPSSDVSLLGLLSLAQKPGVPGEDPRNRATFLPFAVVICDHFRNLAHNPLLASSELMFSLSLVARQVLLSLRDEMIRAREAQSRDCEALGARAGGLIWFYGTAAFKATRMDIQRTLEASACLGFVGLMFLDADFDAPALTAVKNLTSLAKCGLNKLQDVSARELAQILLPLRWIQILAGEMNHTATIAAIQTMEDDITVTLANYGDLRAMLDREEREDRGLALDQFEPAVVLSRILRRRRQPDESR